MNSFLLKVLCLILLCVVTISNGEGGDCDGRPRLVSPQEWKAREPVRTDSMRLPLSHVIIEHTASRSCHTEKQCAWLVRAIQKFHMDIKGMWDVGYNFLIGGDGQVYVGRGWNHTGAHAINFNTNSFGVAFIGNYMEISPTNEMLNAALDLVECGVRKGYLTASVEISGHRDVTKTLSPGDNVYRIIRTWKRFKGGRMTNYHDPNKKDLGYANSEKDWSLFNKTIPV